MIGDAFIKIVATPHDLNDYNAEDFKITLIQSMIKNKLLNDEYVLGQLEKTDNFFKDLRPVTATRILSSVERSQNPNKTNAQIIKKILSKNSQPYSVLRSAIYAATNIPKNSKDINEIYTLILNQPETNEDALELLTRILIEKKNISKTDKIDLLSKVKKHPKSDPYMIEEINTALSSLKSEF